MPIEIATLATTVVTSLLLPYVKKGAEKLTESVAEQVGTATGQNLISAMQAGWARVKAAFGSTEDQQALAQFEKRPEAAKALVEAILKEKLANDPTLVQELSMLIAPLMAGGASTGAQINNAETAGIVDARNANFAGTQGVTLIGAVVNEPPAKSSKSAS